MCFRILYFDSEFEHSDPFQEGCASAPWGRGSGDAASSGLV